MATVNVEGLEIHVDERGEGPPVVLCHSSGLSSAQWRRLRDRMAPDHRMLAPDFVGYGRSAPWPGPAPFDFHTNVQVVEAVAAMAGAPVHLVGHSYGGLLALKAAERGRIPIASLALFDPVAFGVLFSSNDTAGMADLAGIDADGTFFAPALEGTAAWAEQFVDYWNGAGFWSRLPPPQQAAFMANGRKMFQEVRSLSSDRTPHQAYRAIAAPALLLTGSDSPPAARGTAEILARTLPHGRLLVVEGAGHMGPLTHAGAINGAIELHIRAVESNR